MSECTDTSAEEALILITCACSGSDHVQDFMRRAKIRPAKGVKVSNAILAHYRTRSGYDLRRFAGDFRCSPHIEEIAA